MAIGATAVWEVRTTGSDSNGGFYTSGGTDYSQQDAAQLTVTDCVTNGTTTVTSATGGFTAAMIGNGINIAGTIRQITARTDTNTITVDATVGAATGQTAKVGGAVASIGKIASSLVAGNAVWIKSGTYATSSSSNVSGGRVDISTTTVQFRGYGSTRGDGTKPVLQASFSSGVYLLQLTGIYCVIRDLAFDCNSQASTCGCRASAARTMIHSCEVYNLGASGLGILGSASGSLIAMCDVRGVSTSGTVGIRNGPTWRCRAKGVATGFDGGGSGVQWFECVADSCTTGFSNAEVGVGGFNCAAISCTTGYTITAASSGAEFVNCIADGCTTSVNVSGTFNAGREARLVNFANRTGTISASIPAGNQINTITMTATPFTNAASGDYSLNSTAGAGAALKQAGYASFGWSGSTGYIDVGPVQAQATAVGTLHNPGWNSWGT